MSVAVFDSIQDLESCIGEEVGIGDWVTISQDRVNAFAECTNDHQWIHTDIERCKKESPFGAPIAHGFLTISMMPSLLLQMMELREKFEVIVNFKLNKVNFIAPVVVGSEVRARAKLLSVKEIKDGHQVTWKVTMEIKGHKNPAYIAETVYRYMNPSASAED